MVAPGRPLFHLLQPRFNKRRRPRGLPRGSTLPQPARSVHGCAPPSPSVSRGARRTRGRQPSIPPSPSRICALRRPRVGLERSARACLAARGRFVLRRVARRPDTAHAKHRLVPVRALMPRPPALGSPPRRAWTRALGIVALSARILTTTPSYSSFFDTPLRPSARPEADDEVPR